MKTILFATLAGAIALGAVAEAGGYPIGFKNIAPYFYANGQLPNVEGASERIGFLQTACPAAKDALSAKLGRLYADEARGAEGIGDAESASTYARLAIAAYEAYLPSIAGKESTGSMVAATNRELKDLQELAGKAAPSGNESQ